MGASVNNTNGMMYVTSHNIPWETNFFLSINIIFKFPVEFFLCQFFESLSDYYLIFENLRQLKFLGNPFEFQFRVFLSFFLVLVMSSQSVVSLIIIPSTNCGVEVVSPSPFISIH